MTHPSFGRSASHAARLLVLTPFLIGLPACSDGGEEDRPQSDVQIARNHHVVGIIGNRAFSAYPLLPTRVSPLVGEIEMNADSAYILRSAGQSQEDRYALEQDGELTLFQTRTNASTLVYRGAYGLADDTGNLFFTDRITENVGLYFGVPLITGTPDLTALAGDWHAFSLHALFAAATSLPSVTEVGRAFAGTATLAADGTVTGSGSETLSPSAALPIAGTLRAFQNSSFTLDLTYGSDTRTFEGGGNDNTIVLAGTDESGDGAAGLAALMRKRTTAPDFTSLQGIYDVGGWFLYVDPAEIAFDAAVGSIELTLNGDFLLDVRNNAGGDLRFDGSFTFTADGALNFDLDNPNENWLGAVDAGNDTLIFVDNTSSATGEGRRTLRFFVAIRRKAV